MLPVSPQLNLSGGELIVDEKFDFDFPVSPPDNGPAPVKSSSVGDSHNSTFTCDATEDIDAEKDEEVFFGPVGHNEQCIAVAVDEEAKIGSTSWSPLSSEQHVELFKESQMLLYHLTLTSNKSVSSPGGSKTPKTKPLTGVKSSSPVFGEPPVLVEDSSKAAGSKCKRKLSDTSFLCGTYSDSDVSSVNISQLSLIDKQSEHSSPEADKTRSSSNITFTLNPPEGLPHNLSAVLPKGKLTPNAYGVVTFGAKSSEKKDHSAKNKKSSLLKPPGRRAIPVLSPPKRMKVCPTPESISQQSHVIQNNKSSSSLVKPASTTRRSLNNPPKKSGLKPPNLNNTFNLPSVSAPCRNSGMKPPTVRNLLAAPNKSDPVGRSPGLNRTYNNSTAQSGMRAPSATGLKAPSTSSINSVKKEVKAPISKPQLMKPNPVSLQRKTLAANRSKLTKPGESTGLKVPGPVKAVIPARPASIGALHKPTTTSDKKTSKTGSDSHSVKPEATVKEGKTTIQSTPVKQQKKFQPKKIFPGQAPPKQQPLRLSSTPGKESTSSPGPSEKRRSFLPTPKRASLSGFRSSGSSVSSIDSVISNSPAFPMKSQPLHCPVIYEQPGRAKVQHTPVGGNKENEPKRSIWSPVPRPKAISQEEELTQCTKRTVLKLKN